MLYVLILASFLMQIQCTAAIWYEFEFISTENSNTGFIRTDFRVVRINKTVFAIKGPFEFIEDLGDKYDVKLYHSPKGNNQYTLMPAKVARGLCCTLMETVYWTAVHKEVEKVSDIPKRDADKRLCFSYKKGKYLLDGFLFDQKVIPKFADTGSYKVEILIYEKDVLEASSKYAVFGRLY